MKKLLIFLVVISCTSIMSCSDDDEVRDRVIGNWILEEINPSTLFDPSTCTNNSTVQIEGDNTLTADFYFEQNNCELTSGNGTWERTDDSTYTMVFPDVGSFTGTVNFINDDRFIFTEQSGIEFTFQRQL